MLIHRTYRINNWSCLPVSLAMVVDKPVSEVLEMIGQTGSQILWPELPSPLCRRGFAVNEIIIAALAFDCHLVSIIPTWPLRPVDNAPAEYVILDHSAVSYCFSHFDGLILGETLSGNAHAVAWDREQKLILDPNGSKYPREGFGRIEVFLARTNK